MRIARIDLKSLQKASQGYYPEIREALNLKSHTSLWSRFTGDIEIRLSDLNEICRIVHRDPADFIVFEEKTEKEKAALTLVA